MFIIIIFLTSFEHKTDRKVNYETLFTPQTLHSVRDILINAVRIGLNMIKKSIGEGEKTNMLSYLTLT